MRTLLVASLFLAFALAQTSQFTLQFNGRLQQTISDSDYHYSSKATSQTLSTVITPSNGVYMNVSSGLGAAALLEADLHFDSFGPDLRHGNFAGAGNVTFGVHGTLDHIIFFQTVPSAKGRWERTTSSSTLDGVGGYFDIIGGQGAFDGANGFLALVGTIDVTTLNFQTEISGVVYYNSTMVFKF